MRRALLVLTLFSLAGCQPPAKAPTAASPPAPSTVAEAPVIANELPLPIEMFEMYCYRTGGQYKTIVATAKAMKLKPIPKEMEPLIAAQEGGGRAFVVKMEKDGANAKSILLGASDRNTCSVAAMGYDAPKLLAYAKEQYKLYSVMRDDIGLQVNEMFIPGGTSKRISETHEKGMIGVVTAKPNASTGDLITLSYISPETAKQLFQ